MIVGHGILAARRRRLIYIRQGTNLKTVVKHAGVYCKEARQNKVKVFIPLEPQPDPADVVLLQRYYTKHTQDASYEKRVSWVEYPGAPRKAMNINVGVLHPGHMVG